jgi:hypothetical protein
MTKEEHKLKIPNKFHERAKSHDSHLHRERRNAVLSPPPQIEETIQIEKPKKRLHQRTPSADTLDELYKNQKIWKMFQKYAQEELSDENLILYHSIRVYEKSSIKERKNLAKKIYNEFLTETSNSWANIPSNDAQEVKKILDSNVVPSTELFDFVMKITKENISDTYGRFMMNSIFVNKK